jgi:hypothetical protein
MNKTILYYTCNTHRREIDQACRSQLLRAGLPIVCVSLNNILDFGDKNMVLYGQRSPEMMHAQIEAGLELVLPGAVFFCESDVLYHPSHFDFTPQRDGFWYNENTFKVDYMTGRCVFYHTKQVSGLCADRDLLVDHYRLRMARIAQDGKFDRRMGYEPGCHAYPRGVDHYKAYYWMSEYPNLDIRHDKNITKSKWSLDDFRDKSTSRGWRYVQYVPYWGNPDRIQELINELLIPST